MWRQGSGNSAWKDRFEVRGVNACIPHSKRKRPPSPSRGQKFLKGPIPLTWLQEAARLPGKALHVGIALWFRSGLTRSSEISLSLSSLNEFGIGRFSAMRGLRALEKAKLVSVGRRIGRPSLVTLLEPKDR